MQAAPIKLNMNEMSVEWKIRRQRLMDQMANNSIAILPGATTQYRNNDAEYPFRQDSNFYYLTGFCEPDAVTVLLKDAAGKTEYILFCLERNPLDEMWIGKRAGVIEAVSEYSADRAHPVSELESLMPELLANKEKIYYSLGKNKEFDGRMLKWMDSLRTKTRKGIHAPETWLDLMAIIHALRVIKSPKEIALIKEACRISSKGHKHLMRQCKPLKWEYELEGDFIHTVFNESVRFMAYSSIVATGKNACTLHYVENNQQLKEGELLLVDAGCEYQYYASDITRTYPVNGRFSVEQRAIYELVLQAQMAAIAEVRPGVRWNKLQEMIVDILVQGLIKLGILHGDKNKLIQEKAYRPFYMHSSGHWLGLDVHDAGEYKVDNEWRKLEPGMVFTIEPGLYFSENCDTIDQRWRGIGIRIEDDILVIKEGAIVLTEEVPKTVIEIENWMNPL